MSLVETLIKSIYAILLIPRLIWLRSSSLSSNYSVLVSLLTRLNYLVDFLGNLSSDSLIQYEQYSRHSSWVIVDHAPKVMDDKDTIVIAIGLLTTIEGLLNLQAPRIYVAKSLSLFRIDLGIDSLPPKSTNIRVTKRIDNIVLMIVRDNGNENVVSSNVERDIDIRSHPFFTRHRKVVSKSTIYLPYYSRIVNLVEEVPSRYNPNIQMVHHREVIKNSSYYSLQSRIYQLAIMYSIE